MKRKNSKVKFPMKVNVIAELRSCISGKIIERSVAHNTVVSTGKYNVGDYLGNLETGIAGFPYIAIGESESADSVVVGDTALVSEVARELATIARSGNEVTFEKTFSFGIGESYAIEEAGLFDSATETGSVMFNRALFTTKNVGADTELYIKITISVG